MIPRIFLAVALCLVVEGGLSGLAMVLLVASLEAMIAVVVVVAEVVVRTFLES